MTGITGMGDLMLRFPKMQVSGVEIASAYLEVAAERNLAVQEAFLEELPWEDGVFDAVVCTDVLEHVLDVNVVMRELLRVLAPGGVIVARVPDMEPVAWTGQTYEFVHLRIFDEGTLTAVVRPHLRNGRRRMLARRQHHPHRREETVSSLEFWTDNQVGGPYLTLEESQAALAERSSSTRPCWN